MKLHSLINKTIDALCRKDRETLLGLLTEDALLSDPHYPHQEMKGKTAIAEGLQWGFANIKEFHFDELHYTEDAKGSTAAVEYHCSHLLPHGKSLDFKQVIMFESNGSHITSIRAYEPYGPPGLNGAMLKASHIFYSLKSKKLR